MLFFGCTRSTQDTCTLHQRKYRSVILITIKFLNIRTDRSDPDQTAMSSLIRLYTALSFTEYAFTAIKRVI